MRHLVHTLRVFFVLVLALGSWQALARQSASGRFASAAAQGLTVVVSPSTIAPALETALTIHVIDAQGASVNGAKISILTGSARGRIPLVGDGPVDVTVKPRGSGPITVSASKDGYQTASAQVRVRAPTPPAFVSALLPSMSLQPAGARAYRRAALRNVLDFKWRARTGATERGSLSFVDGSVLDLDHSTAVLIKNPARTYLDSGQVFLQVVSGGESHDLETGNAIAASLGTRYTVKATVVSGELVTVLTVFSGRVAVTGAGVTVSVGPGQRTIVRGHRAPSKPLTVTTGGLLGWTGGLPIVPSSSIEHVAFLLQGGGGTLAAFSLDRQQVVRTQPMPERAVDLAASPDAAHLYIATTNGVWDDRLPKGSLRRLAAGLSPRAIALMSTKRLAVANGSGNNVLVIDTSSGASVVTVPLGYSPTGIAVSLGGTTAIVVGAGEVSLVDLSAGKVITTRDVTGAPGRPTFSAGGDMAYAPFADQLLELSVAAEGVIGSVQIGTAGEHAPAAGAGNQDYPAAITAPNGLVFGADYGSRQIEVIDPGLEKVIARFNLAARPINLAFAPDQKLLVVTASQSGLFGVNPFDGSTLTAKYLGGLSDPIAISRLPRGSSEYTPSTGSSVPPIGPIPILPGGIPTATATVLPTGTPTMTSTPTTVQSPTATATATATATPASFPLEPNSTEVDGTFRFVSASGNCHARYQDFQAPIDLKVEGPNLVIHFTQPPGQYGYTGPNIDPSMTSTGPITLDGTFNTTGDLGMWVGQISVHGASTGVKWTLVVSGCVTGYTANFVPFNG